MHRPSGVQGLWLAGSMVALLAGCGWADDGVAVGARGDDPAVAFGDQMMIDFDVAGWDQADGAPAGRPGDGPVPAIDRGVDAVAAARSDALRLVGGPGMMMKAPEPGETATGLPAEAALAAAERAAASPGGSGDCVARVWHTLPWATRLPAAFPVYPRGTVQDAAGTDEDGCSLRVVNFVTPVPLSDVIDFYFSRARAAGFSARRALQKGDDVLGGVRNGEVYLVYARRLPSGNTEVDLVTGGI